MSSGGASAKQTAEQQKKTDIEELMEQAKATSKRQGARSIEDEKSEKKSSASSSKFAKIDQNAFFKIMFDADATPKEKMEAVTKALSFAESKEDANARLEEFKQFKEYLQFERKRMAQQIIELTDTEAFSELKEVYDELNNALLSFEEKINPLT